jgi:hypothetical protein
VLFVQLAGQSRALMATCALSAARHLWPQGRVDILVDPHSQAILRGSLAVDNIYTTPPMRRGLSGASRWVEKLRLVKKLRQTKYDWVFDLTLQGAGRGWALMAGGRHTAAHIYKDTPWWQRLGLTHSHRVDIAGGHPCMADVALLQSAGYKAEELPRVEFDRSFVDWSWVHQNLTQTPILIELSPTLQDKLQNPEKIFAALSGASAVVLIGSQTGIHTPSAKVIGQQLPWPQLAGVVYSSSVVVAQADSPLLALAIACGVPSVALAHSGVPMSPPPWDTPYVQIALPTPDAAEKIATACLRLRQTALDKNLPPQANRTNS